SAQLRRRLLHEPAHLARLTGVRDRAPDPPSRRAHGRFRLSRAARALPEGKGHVGPALREREHHRPPKTRAPAGDDGDLPLEPGPFHAVAGNLPNLWIISASPSIDPPGAGEDRKVHANGD